MRSALETIRWIMALPARDAQQRACRRIACATGIACLTDTRPTALECFARAADDRLQEGVQATTLRAP
jgi:hypothetical protein